MKMPVSILVALLAVSQSLIQAQTLRPRAGARLADPLRVQGGKFYDLTFVVTNYNSWSEALSGSYPAESSMRREQARLISLHDPGTHPWGKFIVSGYVIGKRPDGLVLGPNPYQAYGIGEGTARAYVLLQNSPFTKRSSYVTALAIPIGQNGDMAVYDYGVPVKSPPPPPPPKPKTTNTVIKP